MMSTAAEQISLVYILSSGRSGTTLLDLLLGAHPEVWTMGEVQLLPWELTHRNRPCGCGASFEEDPFWRSVLSEVSIDTEGYHVGYFRNREHVGQVLRWSHLPDLLRGSLSDRWQSGAEEYGEHNSRLFQAVHSVAESRAGERIQWLVDASKDPYRLFWLQAHPQIELRVIHMLKDPRSFVCSAARPWLSKPSGIRKVVRFTARWIIENAIMSRLCRTCFSDENVRRMQYEHFAQRPEETMNEITDWLGLEKDGNLTRRFRDYENHAVSGNAMRWQDSDDEIRLDQRWKQQLPQAYGKFIDVVTCPFLQYCGYRH
jgi:hypothetical protein